MRCTNRRPLLPALAGAAALLVVAAPASAELVPIELALTVDEVSEILLDFFDVGDTGTFTAVIDTRTPDMALRGYRVVQVELRTPDIDGDGVVNFVDLSVLHLAVGGPPGPSCISVSCD